MVKQVVDDDAPLHSLTVRVVKELHQKLVNEAKGFASPLNLQKYLVLIIENRDVAKIKKSLSK